MSEEKLYMVKNDEGKYWSFNNLDGLWKLDCGFRTVTVSEDAAKNVAKHYGGHVVTLIEEPEKVVLTKEQAKIVDEAHGFYLPATLISKQAASEEEEELLMRAYVNGYSVEKEPKYNVKVFNGYRGYLNVSHVTSKFMTADMKQTVSYQTQFTETEIAQLKRRDDIALDWDKVKLIEVDNED